MLGQGLPLVVGLIVIPRLVHVLGVDRFGVLMLTWAVMGYFSLFDFGLARALTQVISTRSGLKIDIELPDIIQTALIMMLGLGLFGGLVLGGLSPLIAGKLLKASSAIRGEVLYAFALMAISVPAVTLLAGMRGILEARQRFFEISLLRVGMGILTFVGPWLISFWTTHLFWVVLSLEVMRYLALAAHYWVCRRVVPEMRSMGKFRPQHWGKLLRIGGWMTVSNTISPIMVNFDRFFIGIFISIEAVAYYTTPFDFVGKIQIVSSAIASVVFPAFGANYKSNPKEAVRLYHKGMQAIGFILAPMLIAIAIGAHWLLLHWLGNTFAEQSSQILRILCLGILINSLAVIPFVFIQGAGRPDLTAKLHLGEVSIYLILLWQLGVRYGIVGVAWAWVIRVTFDLIVLLLVADRMQQSIKPMEN